MEKEIREEGYATHIKSGIDIRSLKKPRGKVAFLLGKAVSLPRHTDHQLFALHRTGEPVA